MKKVIAITILLTLVLAAVSKGTQSPNGGSLLKGEGFNITVPTFDTNVKQGQIQLVTISLERGQSFKQDVTLEIKLFKGEGITLDPAKILVKAGDKPDVQLTITAPKDAALGEYIVSVTGIPTTGQPTSVKFEVNVVDSKSDYTIKSYSPVGGSTIKTEGFRIAVPTFATKVKPGQIQVVTISLERGEFFKQDVKLKIEADKTISVDPAKVIVKAGDKPDVQLTITAPKDAAMGEYSVSVTGTPTTGQPALVKFNVKVVDSDANGVSTLKEEGFKIVVPFFDTKVKQGEIQIVTIELERGKSFKQDVNLKIEAAKGISINPDKVLVKAGDKPEVQLTITAPKDAAFGEYIVSVTGTPTTSQPSLVKFNVKVVDSKADYTIKSDSPKGGSTLKGEGFKIAVPTFDTKVKQGQIQTVILSLERGKSFNQDVMLEINLSQGEGITFDPAKVLVKAGDKPDVQLTITAPKDSALGEYIVSVTGTPTTGEPTSVKFNVKVTTP